MAYFHKRKEVFLTKIKERNLYTKKFYCKINKNPNKSKCKHGHNRVNAKKYFEIRNKQKLKIINYDK